MPTRPTATQKQGVPGRKLERAVTSVVGGRAAHDVVEAALPIVGVVAAVVIGNIKGLATGILILAATALLVSIWQLWSSLQVIADDEPAKEAGLPDSHGLEDEQKAFLLRALDDLEFERSVGKIDEDDYRDLRENYRARARAALRGANERLRPFREEAERLVSTPQKRRAAQPVDASPIENEPSLDRVACQGCSTNNERDAQFCKRCGVRLATSEGTSKEGP